MANNKFCEFVISLLLLCRFKLDESDIPPPKIKLQRGICNKFDMQVCSSTCLGLPKNQSKTFAIHCVL